MVERRRGLVGPGLTDPGMVFPEVGQARVVRELQEQIEALYRKLSEMEAASDARVEWRPAAAVIEGAAAAKAKRASGVELSDEDPEAVGSAASPGTGEAASREDHVHEGIPPVDAVTALPAIPTTGTRIVFWTSAGGGTGDDQDWMAHAGQSAWTNMQFTTTKSGTP